ncbi:hypothetical protein [Endozoicomonas sp.]|uniref:hypothetical protein n=1 Tax=Endozoicomonas sp. TaxID=1892382 RepID=UPI003839EE81
MERLTKNMKSLEPNEKKGFTCGSLPVNFAKPLAVYRQYDVSPELNTSDHFSALPCELIQTIAKKLSLRDCLQLKFTNKIISNAVDSKVIDKVKDKDKDKDKELYLPKEIGQDKLKYAPSYHAFNSNCDFENVEFKGAMLPGFESFPIEDSDYESKIQKVYSCWKVETEDVISDVIYGVLENKKTFSLDVGSNRSFIDGYMGEIKIAPNWRTLFNEMNMTNIELTDFVDGMNQNDSKQLIDMLKDLEDRDQLRNHLIAIFDPTIPE